MMGAFMDYKIIVGLEVHVQLLTQSKLFCGCSTKFGQSPNSATCPVCIGMPGVLPVMNRQAFELALRAALALNCEIPSYTKWDRKNYYYPDLPKNYQISQYDLPFSKDGWLEIQLGETSKRIGIIRAHLEEDAGKMMHDEHGRGRDSMVDLNRAGTPLLEIVSKPDMNTPEEAEAYLEEIRLLLREIGVSDCEMQEGSLRVDANVNVQIPRDGNMIPTPIVEVKNVNSFRAVRRAIAYEAERQFGDFKKTGIRMGDKGGDKATAGWDDARGITIIQRRKEEASDYRYFPEPDLVPIEVDLPWLERVRANTPELPATRRGRFRDLYKLSPYDAHVIVSQGHRFADYFEEVAKTAGDSKAASNWCTNQVLALLNEKKLPIEQSPITATVLAEVIGQVKTHNINMQRARELFGKVVESGDAPAKVVKDMGLDVKISADELRTLVLKSIAANAKAVADVKAGKGKAIDALVGFVMRETKGKAPTDLVRQIMQEELAKQ
jgi:aspartyl-tRNA(Asn)/glutamyl-tRNA(Gln) amidotransferase subunit B